MKKRPVKERFMESFEPVTESGCWIWMKTVFHDGYGQIKRDGKTSRAHRLSYELFSGPIPADMCVLHKCDVRACVNPAHLFLGTNADNMADKIAKGRQSRQAGSDRYNAKLTEQNVVEIRKSRLSQRDIARKFLVSYQLISDIKAGKVWRHVK